MMRYVVSLGSFLNFAASDAGGTNADALGCALHDGAHGLEIEIPAAFGNIMRMADSVAELGSAAANFTYFRHNNIDPRV